MTDNITFELDLSDMLKDMNRLGSNLAAALPKAAMAGAMVIKNHVAILIQQSPAGGETYTRGNISHTASAPGQPPATDTGFLVNALIVRAGKSGPTFAEAYEGSTAEYDEGLEFGTSRVEARPHHRPAVDNNVAAITQAVMAVLQGAIK